MNHTLKSFTTLVHKMRLAQERYFDLAKEARKTGIHKKEQKDALVISKNLEHQVDATIQEINKEMATLAADGSAQATLTAGMRAALTPGYFDPEKF